MENKIKIVLATGNPHKLQEINEITKDSGIEFILPGGDFNPVENGQTFEQNSLIKAQEASRISNMISLADDSGLCVDALNGEPGIHSARYDTTPQRRIDKLLKKLADTDNRKAKFVCVMTLTDKDGNVLNQEIGECHGQIATEQYGTNGFGYDPVFLVDGYDITMAQMSEDLKNTISHRANALSKMVKYIKENL
ncbi:RdgB/HAM1 family non-canonical purine NTP pyrophosphatase [bacterium]|nr:RdgB/HAM1 family non-canonical purine NTP pyrophosphatase [bacterium]